MTQRERYLAIAVGVLVSLYVINIGYTRVTKSLSVRENRLDDSTSDLNSLNRTIQVGERAASKLVALEKKSLPSSKEQAEKQYLDWLQNLAEHAKLDKVKVVLKPSAPLQAGAKAPAFASHEFQLTGECSMENVVDLLASYYDRDYLHRIKSLKLSPTQQPGTVSLDMSSQVLALSKADSNQPAPKESSGRLVASLQDYKESILSRNPFAPPNRGPDFQTKRSHDVTIGKPWTLALEAKDPENSRIRFELVTSQDKLPKGLSLSRGELSWEPKEKGEYEVLVRAIDGGWPRKSSDLKLTLKAVEPPPSPVEEKPATLDAASQAFLTGLVSGRSGPQGWLRSKSEGLSIDLYEGAEIAVGSVKAKVIKINVRKDNVEMETEGNRWIFDMDTSLADAFKKGQVD
jgi:hypothetical protein